MNLQDQLNKVKAVKAAKQLEIKNLLTKALEDEATPEGDAEEVILSLEEEVATLEKNVARISKLIADSEQSEDNVEEVTKTKAMNTLNGNKAPAVAVVDNMDKGIGYAKFVKSLLTSQQMAKSGSYVSPLDIAKSRNEPEEVLNFIKATATTTAAGYSALVQPQTLQNEFVELLRANTVFDQLASGMRKVPFNVRIPTQSAGGTAKWVGEAAKKPSTNQAFGVLTLKRHKIAGITTISEELLKDSSPSVDALIRDDLIAALSQLTDETFLDNVVGTEVRPSGLLNGVTALVASGRTAAAYQTDLAKLKNQFITNNLSLAGVTFIMSEVQASEMSMIRDPMGNAYFAGMEAGFNQKTLMGIPVLETQNAGTKLVLVKTSEILLADEGGLDIQYSNEATVDGVSLWENNLMAIRVERHLTWAKRRPIASSFIEYATVPMV